MKYVLCLLISYLIGTINPSYIIAKLRGFDIREKGSKNAGASNALILFGKVRGVGCALFDIAKATFAIWLCGRLFPELAYSFAVTGIACILGHVFPFYMKFRGGKGLSCFGGMILAFDWRVFLILLAVEILVAIVTDYICFVPLSAAAVFPIVYGVMRRDVWGALMVALILPLMIYKHRGNLRRIKQKTEMPFSFLWNKEKALAKTNLPKE
jgi:glycerol-3-phosphate acyltransferase PlsY